MSSKRREPDSTQAVDTAGPPIPEAVLRLLQTALVGLRYGSICLIVHDGVVVQIERNEKLRVDR